KFSSRGIDKSRIIGSLSFFAANRALDFFPHRGSTCSAFNDETDSSDIGLILPPQDSKIMPYGLGLGKFSIPFIYLRHDLLALFRGGIQLRLQFRNLFLYPLNACARTRDFFRRKCLLQFFASDR